MPNNKELWEEKTLGDICYIGAGNSAPQDKTLFENGIYPFFRTADVGKIHFGKIYTSSDLLNEKGIKGLKLFKKGTILIPKSGASTFLNHRVKMEVDGYVVSHLATVKGKENIITDDFLLYYLSTVKVQDLIQDQNYPSVNLPIISNIKIMLPPLNEQQRIVGILDEAFENIEKAKQNTLTTLNNAKELFDNNLYNLFTKNTELWNEDSLHNICAKISAGGDKPEIFSNIKTDECFVPVYSNGIKDNGLYGYTNKPTIDKPAITISARGTIGFVCKRLEPYCPIVRLISLIPKDYIDLSFLAYAMNFVIPKNTGTSIPQLTVPNLKNSIIKYPLLEEQQKIVQQLDELQEQTKKLEQIYEQKLKDLDELKQSILQKAFNGEL